MCLLICFAGRCKVALGPCVGRSRARDAPPGDFAVHLQPPLGCPEPASSKLLRQNSLRTLSQA